MIDGLNKAIGRKEPPNMKLQICDKTRSLRNKNIDNSVWLNRNIPIQGHATFR